MARLLQLRAVAVVAFAAALLLGGSVAVADPAGARRNLGGTTPGAEGCVQPAGALVVDRNSSTVPCVCVDTPLGGVVLNAGRKPDTTCPTGILGGSRP
jgi:hypothetical protein